MEFVAQNYQMGETIAAIATPPGEGGVAIIRISGDLAVDVAERMYSGPIRSYISHTAHFGKIYNGEGEHVDDVLLLVMYGPRSYTGENTVEIHCHGGSLISRHVLETALHAGARAALPGEFTFRSFINGKMDLAQAEAVQELIGAKNDRALYAADNQLQGALSKSVSYHQQELTKIAAILEAWVDFPEEGLAFTTMEELFMDLKKIRTSLEKLAATFHEGKILHDGLSLCLVGCPNVGKSSLMNALLGKDRAIVSQTPGTTRDILEDHLKLSGLHIKLSDTAGIRETIEGIEQEGIRRSKIAMQEADVVLFVLDAQSGWTIGDEELFGIVPKDKTIVVWNKIDVASGTAASPLPLTVFISAKEGLGLETLHKAIDQLIWQGGPPSKEEIVITNVRHQQALLKAVQAIDHVLESLRDEISPEFITIDMRQALLELGKILGTNISEDILSSIFSQFCIGK